MWARGRARGGNHGEKVTLGQQVEERGALGTLTLRRLDDGEQRQPEGSRGEEPGPCHAVDPEEAEF